MHQFLKNSFSLQKLCAWISKMVIAIKIIWKNSKDSRFICGTNPRRKLNNFNFKLMRLWRKGEGKNYTFKRHTEFNWERIAMTMMMTEKKSNKNDEFCKGVVTTNICK